MSIEADKLAPREQREDDLMAKPKITAKPKAKAKLTAKVKAKSRARPKTKPYYRTKVLEAVVERMVEGESLREICGEDGAPDRSTILRWFCDDDDLATIMARDGARA